MSIDIDDISEQQRDTILALEEGHYADLKAVEIRPGRLTESISAFANADGGELYVGVDEDRANRTRGWRGFQDPEAANAHLQVFEQLFPLGRDFSYGFLRCNGEHGLVLQIQIQKTRDVKKASDGYAYVRRGAQNLRCMTLEAQRQLEYTKGLSSFETEIVDVPVDLVTNSNRIIGFMLEVVPTAEPELWLRKQQLIREDKPAVAAILLFADEPQALLPKRCGVKIYRYTTKDRQGSRETLDFDPLTVEGPLYDQIHECVALTRKTIEDTRRLGQETLEEIRYPVEAIHEIVTNAVLHRDYSLPDDVHIRVFDNRIEIESPGRLPGHITVRNILDERFARNGQLVRLLNKFPNPPNKDVGEGLNTAFAAMTKLGLKEPVIQERENSVLVTIKHEPLASPEEAILEYLEANRSIRNKKAREVAHVSADYVIKEVFNRLVARGLIQKVEGTRTASTAYERGPKYDTWRRALKAAD